MKIYLLKTYSGLKPLYEDDFDFAKKLKNGEVYSAEIKLSRNYKFHKKYFALIKCAFEFLREDVREKYFADNINNFRKTLQVAAGHSEKVFSIERREFVEQSLSIDFESMNEDQFSELYDRVLDVLFKTFLKNINSTEFETALDNF